MSQPQVKAFNLRGILSVLRREGRLSPVAETVSVETRAVMTDPPLPMAWLDASLMNEVYTVIAKHWGEAELRRMVRAATEQGALVVLRPAAEAMLRLFGVSPAMLLARIPMFASTNSRGYEWHYFEEGPKAGLVRMSIPGDRNVPRAAFVALSGTLEVVLDLCHAKGRVSDPEMLENGRANAAQYRVTWE